MDLIIAIFYTVLALHILMIVVRYGYVVINHVPVLPEDATESDTVTIVLPSYNDGASITRTLDSIYTQNYPRHLINVVVIDDGSTDDTHVHMIDWVNCHKDLVVSVRRNVPNTGNKAKAIKPHVDLITGIHLVIIDGDGALDENAIRVLVSTLKRAGPDVTSVSGSPRVPTQSTILGQLQQVDFHYNYSTHKQYESLCDSVIVCSGAISIFDSATFKRHDGLHTNVLVEDVVFSCGELFKYGNKTRYNIDAVVWTDIQPTWRKFYMQRKRWGFGIMEALMVGNMNPSSESNSTRTTWQTIQSFGTIMNMLVLAHIMTLMTIPVAIMTGGYSLLVQFMCKSVVITLDLCMGAFFRHGVPDVVGGSCGGDLSVFKRFALLFIGSIIIRCAMLSATIHQLTNRKKTWFTR